LAWLVGYQLLSNRCWQLGPLFDSDVHGRTSVRAGLGWGW